MQTLNTQIYEVKDAFFYACLLVLQFFMINFCFFSLNLIHVPSLSFVPFISFSLIYLFLIHFYLFNLSLSFFHFLLFRILSVSLCKKSFFIPSRILFKFLLSARRFYWVVASQAESERWVCQVSTTTAAVAEAGPSSCPNSWTRTVSWHVHT